MSGAEHITGAPMDGTPVGKESPVQPGEINGNALSLLRSLWPEEVDGWLSLCVAKKAAGVRWKTDGHYPVDQLRELQKRGRSLADGGHDVWYSVCAQEGQPLRGRGGEDTVRWVPALWADLDGKVVPLDVLAERCRALVRPPQVLVRTGNGFHAYWLLQEPFEVDSEEARSRIKRLNLRLHQWLCGEFRVDFDKVQSLDHMLRLPGTFNHKQEPPRPVQVVWEVEGRYPIADLDEVLPDLGDDAVERRNAGDFSLQGTLDRAEAEELIERMLPRYVEKACRGEGRDTSGFAFAQQLNDHYVPQDLAYRALRDYSQQVPTRDTTGQEDPFTEEDARRKVDSAWQYPPRGPAIQSAMTWDPAEFSDDGKFDRLVQMELDRLRVRAEAQERLDRERNGRRAGALEVLSAQDVVELPEPRWLIDSLLPEVGTFQLYGRPGAGKSFVVQDLLLSVATGEDWLGHFPVGRTGPTVYVAAEGGWDMGVRLREWIRHRGVGIPDGFYLMLEEAVDLRSRRDVDEVTAACAELGAVAVVFDTWALHMPGGDENSAKDAGRVIDALKRLSVDLGALVGTVHHTGKDEGRGARGSSAMQAAWDGEFSFDGHVLSHRKNRYGPKHAGIGVELVETGGTLVPRWREPLAAVTDRRSALADDVVDFVRRNPGCGVTQVHTGVGGHKSYVANVVRELVEDGRLWDDGSGKERARKRLYLSEEEGS